MRLKKFGLMAATATIAILIGTFWFSPSSRPAAAPSAGPKIILASKYYAVKGNTAEQIRHDLNQVRPVLPGANRRFDGYTHWQIRWQYWYAKTPQTCRIRKASVRADIASTLPQWQPPRYAAPALIDRWNAYIVALTRHEAGHQQHGMRASQEILATLQTLAAYPTCEQLRQAVDVASNRLIQTYAQRDVRYDRSTNHGASQGAVFP